MTSLEQAAALLRSEDAAGLLFAALTGAADPVPPGFSVRLTNWQYRPGAEATAGYEATYAVSDGTVTEHLFVTTATVGPPAVRASRDGLSFAVWRHPGDPLLPGLAPACSPEEVMRWLDVHPREFGLALLGYRPLRRAVLRATADGTTTYLKVLRPDRADALALRQHLVAGAGLTPPLRSRPRPGVLVTDAAPGRSLAAALADPSRPALPTPAEIVDLLDALPSGLAALPRRPAWSERLDFHAATAAERLPDEAGRIATIAGRIGRVVATAPVGPVGPTHGDLHEANLFVDSGRLGLIDLDAAGPGLREDDLGCLLGHLAVLPGLSPAHYGLVPSLLEQWTGHFESLVDPDALRARTAAVILSLVAGGDGDQAEHRLGLAEAWAGGPTPDGG
ncbi:MAG: phosphotransferase [Propionicimonas sp.]|uniref:phosphotransferase n=1 Tax=Propionicimonas sp. TaxID=1955623 RepID=UPI003D104A4F